MAEIPASDPRFESMRSILAVMGNMGDLVKTFPTVLDEPRTYLSIAQRDVCQRYEALRHLVLPGWVKSRLIAEALGHDLSPHVGINLAMVANGHKPWLWATEFENVHTLWKFKEPEVTIDGRTYKDAETYYQSQKETEWSEAASARWDAKKESLMKKAVWAKFEASPEARDLLISTHPHPLLSIKNDSFFGFDPLEGGQNKLAVILMELRDRYVAGTRYRPMDGR